MAELRPHVDELHRIGVDPYVIGSGTPAEARDFQQHLHAEDVPIYVDQGLASYDAAGWKRSAAATLGPSTWWRGLKSMIAHPQRKTAGDPWQLGGAKIIKPGAQVAWSFRSESSGHHPSIEQILDEARKAVA